MALAAPIIYSHYIAWSMWYIKYVGWWWWWGLLCAFLLWKGESVWVDTATGECSWRAPFNNVNVYAECVASHAKNLWFDSNTIEGWDILWASIQRFSIQWCLYCLEWSVWVRVRQCNGQSNIFLRLHCVALSDWLLIFHLHLNEITQKEMIHSISHRSFAHSSA